MQRWTQAQFDTLAAGATTLMADKHGVKVLLTPDDRIIKLFRRKRWLSSTLIFPYAKRFARASTELAERGIPAVRVEAVARVRHPKRDIVVYRRLPGVTLREALGNATDADRERLLTMLAAMLATLHERGVYFRAAHFGNFIVRDSNGDASSLALIDVSEASFRRAALSPAVRARNFRPMTRYPEDVAAIRAFGVERFIESYLAHARTSGDDANRFRAALDRVHSDFRRE